MTEAILLQALPGAETVGYDEGGNRRARVLIKTTGLTVVIDEAAAVVITVWVE